MSFSSVKRIFCCFSHSSNAEDGPSNTASHHQIIDETTRLIPTTEEPAPSPGLVYVDHARLRERLGTIVRAKEGRMVNVISNRNLQDSSMRGRSSSTVADRFSATASDSESVGSERPSDSDTNKKPATALPTMFANLDNANVKLSLSWGD